MKERADRIAIVGAGPGGLAAARWAVELGIAHDVLERHTGLGGIWDASRPDTPVYDTCRFISSRTLSGFRDLPMPDDWPDYPHHEQILSYLRGFAAKWGLQERIEFGATVTSAVPRGGEWGVRLASGEERLYGGLVVANGHNWDPHRPRLPGEFAGEIGHSRDYSSPDEFSGKRVLVVGAGNSGCDIAADAAAHAERAFLSVRRGYWFVPKHVFGVPSDVFAEGGPHLPARLAQPVFELLLKVVVGNPSRFGLPRPDHRIFETHPVLNTEVLRQMERGRLRAKPDLRELRGDRVLFADGSEEEVDRIVLATGYRHSIPFLPESVFRTGDRSNLFLNVFHDEHPNLFVIGLFENDGGAFPIVDRQAELVMRVIAARRSRPERAAEFAERQRKGPRDFSEGVRHLPLRRMSTYVMTRPYVKYLEEATAGLA